MNLDFFIGPILSSRDRERATFLYFRLPSFSGETSNRFASETLIPTNLLRHKQWLASEKLWRRLRSLTGRPASASRRKPTICASVNRFFVVRPLGGSDPGRYAGHERQSRRALTTERPKAQSMGIRVHESARPKKQRHGRHAPLIGVGSFECV